MLLLNAYRCRIWLGRIELPASPSNTPLETGPVITDYNVMVRDPVLSDTKVLLPKFKADLTAFVKPVSTFTTDGILWCLIFKWWKIFNFVWICDLSSHPILLLNKSVHYFQCFATAGCFKLFLANFISPWIEIL